MDYQCFNLLSGLSFCYSGLFITRNGWKHKHMLLPNYELMIGVKGSYSIYVDHELYTIKPGNILLIKPGETVAGEGSTEQDTSFYWLHFEYNESSSLDEAGIAVYRQKPQNELKNIVILPRFSVINNLPHVEILLRQICVLREEVCYTVLPADLLTANLLINLSGSTVLRNINTGEPRLINLIKEWVQIRINQNISLSDAAAEFNLSREHIARTFKKNTSTTLTSYITDKKIEYAKSLISTGEYSIKEVSEMAGYSDEKYFSHVFSRNQGIPPKVYRNSFGKPYNAKNS